MDSPPLVDNPVSTALSGPARTVNTSVITPIEAVLREATLADLDAMTEIYAWHVLHGTGSFEEDPPSQSAMLERWRLRSEDHYPTLVAEFGGRVAGFAYAGIYKPRSAYRYTVEDSIYVAEDCLGQGVGQALLQELVQNCSRAGYRQMMAVIGDSDNVSSIRLHERCGFTIVGIARGLGFKFGRWLDIVYMQRTLQTNTQPVDRDIA